MTDRIADLPRCFKAAQQLDLAAQRDEAIARADRDFDAMCAVIIADKAPLRPLDPADLAEIRRFDEAPCAPLAMKVKRAIFQQMRRAPSLWHRYERRKFYRRFAIK
ncbi:MAG: hypothetical protein HC788_05220 [Sphingopyxis sp.]|nr:hypothetical protein [Sphingopyxis sp.]